ncbi:hypothetical protein [Marinifilum sp.]|uniref:hypothetical protein n=1 Tax=Marinifilum sp. TaxID=2033137 RepID=UPI003BAD172E
MKNAEIKDLPFNLRKMIENAMHDKYINRPKLQDMLNLSQPGMHYILKRNDMNVSRLFSICKALDVNIFRQIADRIEIEYPVSTESNNMQEENQRMKNRIAELEKECEILRDVIGLQKK